jgi:hypothetical protein
MNKKSICLITTLLSLTASCYANAGFFDRYLEMMDVLYAVLKTTFVSQILVFLFIRFSKFKITKRIRMRLLLLSNRLCKNWWINILAAWALSSFVLTSYWYVFSEGLFMLAIFSLLIFWLLYTIVVFRRKLRVRWLSGLKAIYFYLIASIGQSIVFVLLISTEIMWYIPVNEYTEPLICFLRHTYRIYSFRPLYDENVICFLAKGMCELAVCLALPYIFLIAIILLRKSVNNTNACLKTKEIIRK